MPDPGHHRAPSMLARQWGGRGTPTAPGGHGGRRTHLGRRVTGVHRADGLAGPARRYLLTVVLLAGTASLPIVAVIGSGSATVRDTGGPGTAGALPPPFLTPPSEGPVVVVPLPPPRAGGEPALGADDGRTAYSDGRRGRETSRPPGPARRDPGGDRPVPPGGRPPTAPSRPAPPSPSAPGPGPTGTPAPSPSRTAEPSPTGTPSPEPSSPSPSEPQDPSPPAGSGSPGAPSPTATGAPSPTATGSPSPGATPTPSPNCPPTSPEG